MHLLHAPPPTHTECMMLGKQILCCSLHRHAGCPVIKGEKYVATKVCRQCSTLAGFRVLGLKPLTLCLQNTRLTLVYTMAFGFASYVYRPLLLAASIPS